MGWEAVEAFKGGMLGLRRLRQIGRIGRIGWGEGAGGVAKTLNFEPQKCVRGSGDAAKTRAGVGFPSVLEFANNLTSSDVIVSPPNSGSVVLRR